MPHTVTDSHDMKQSNGRFGQVLSLSKTNNIFVGNKLYSNKYPKGHFYSNKYPQIHITF